MDLYAKALIFLGFGSLAVTGALLDSRPRVDRLPDVPSPEMSVTASVMTDVSVPGLPAEVSDGVSLTLAQPSPEPVPSPLRSRPSLLDSKTAQVTFASPAWASPPTVVAMKVVERMPDLGAHVTLAPVPDSEPSASMPAPVPESVIARSQDDESGFFSGVLKITSASVSKTGASVGTSVGRAGTSLVGAFRLVSDTVKRAF